MALTIPAALRDAAATYGDKPFLVEGDRTVSFADTHAHVRAVAKGYLAAGVRPGFRGGGRGVGDGERHTSSYVVKGSNQASAW